MFHLELISLFYTGNSDSEGTYYIIMNGIFMLWTNSGICFSIILSIIVSIFYIYYKQNVIQKPIVFANTKFKELLLAKCPILKTEYHPPFWCYEGNCQTIAADLFMEKNTRNFYSREILQLKDGGQVGLDWVYNTGNEMYKDENERPVVIYLPGLTGSSESYYFCNFVKAATVLGYR